MAVADFLLPLPPSGSCIGFRDNPIPLKLSDLFSSKINYLSKNLKPARNLISEPEFNPCFSDSCQVTI